VREGKEEYYLLRYNTYSLILKMVFFTATAAGTSNCTRRGKVY
jgi:hypothetical protein